VLGSASRLGARPLGRSQPKGYKRHLLGRTRTLDSHASRLRRKLTANGYGPFVTNVWGVGYRLLD